MSGRRGNIRGRGRGANPGQIAGGPPGPANTNPPPPGGSGAHTQGSSALHLPRDISEDSDDDDPFVPGRRTGGGPSHKPAGGNDDESDEDDRPLVKKSSSKFGSKPRSLHREAVEDYDDSDSDDVPLVKKKPSSKQPLLADELDSDDIPLVKKKPSSKQPVLADDLDSDDIPLVKKKPSSKQPVLADDLDSDDVLLVKKKPSSKQPVFGDDLDSDDVPLVKKSSSKQPVGATDQSEIPGYALKAKKGKKLRAKGDANQQTAAISIGNAKFLQPEDEDYDDVLNDKTRCVTPIQTEAITELQNFKRWAGVKDVLRLSQIVTGRLPSLVPERIDAYLNNDVPGKDYSVESCTFVEKDKIVKALEQDTDGWVIVLKDNTVTKQSSRPDRIPILPCALVTEEDPILAQRTADELCRLVNKCPLPKLKLKPNNFVGQMMILLALSRVEGGGINETDYLYNRVLGITQGFTVAWVQAGQRWDVHLGLIDTDLEHMTGMRRISLKPELITQARDIPKLPLPDSVIAALPDPTFGNLDLDNLDPDKADQHRKTLKLVRWIQFNMFGAVGEWEALKTQAYWIADVYTLSDRKSSAGTTLASLYEGNQLFRIDWKSHKTNTLLKLTTSVEAHILKGSVPDITVLGKSNARVSVVLEAMMQKFLSGANILDVVQEGVIRADQVNHTPAETKLVNSCNHVGEERNNHIHVCQMCSSVAFCKDMRFSAFTNLRVDIECEHKTQETPFDAEERKRTKKDTDAATKSIKSRRIGKAPGSCIRLNFLSELCVEPEVINEAGTDKRKSRSLRQKMVDEFARSYLNEDDDTWSDELTSIPRPDKLSNDGTTTSPFKASLDAPIPVSLIDRKLYYHHQDTSTPTAAWLNQTTNTWPKGTVHAARDSYALKDVPYGDKSMQQIMYRFDHYMAIRTKIPYMKKHRFELGISQSAYDDWLEEMASGISADTEVPASIPAMGERVWNAKDHKRIKSLVQQMIDRWEKINGRELDKNLKDPLLREVPFPFWPEHAPKQWGWNELERFINYHYILLCWWCDRLFIVIEIPENLLLEIVWQWIERGGRGGFLFVAWTLLQNHAACLALGHEIHGQAMRTRWIPTEGPRVSIDQRDDARCNMSVETRIENYMKKDYANKDYPKIIEDLRKTLKDTSRWVRPPPANVPKLDLRIHCRNTKAWQRSAQFMKVMPNDEDIEFDDIREVDEQDIGYDSDGLE